MCPLCARMDSICFRRGASQGAQDFQRPDSKDKHPHPAQMNRQQRKNRGSWTQMPWSKRRRFPVPACIVKCPPVASRANGAADDIDNRQKPDGPRRLASRNAARVVRRFRRIARRQSGPSPCSSGAFAITKIRGQTRPPTGMVRQFFQLSIHRPIAACQLVPLARDDNPIDAAAIPAGGHVQAAQIFARWLPSKSMRPRKRVFRPCAVWLMDFP